MRRFTAFATGLILSVTTLGYAQGSEAPQDRVLPRFKVQIWGDTFEEFNSRVHAYDELRRELEKGLPPFTTTDKPAEIRKATGSTAATRSGYRFQRCRRTSSRFCRHCRTISSTGSSALIWFSSTEEVV